MPFSELEKTLGEVVEKTWSAVLDMLSPACEMLVRYPSSQAGRWIYSSRGQGEIGAGGLNLRVLHGWEILKAIGLDEVI